MAGRNSTYIKVLTNRDINLIKQLAHTGVCAFEQSSFYNNHNSDRLKKLEKSGFIKTDKCLVKGVGQQDFIKLDTKGKNYCRDKLDVKYFYKSDARQIKHDLKLTEAYYTMNNNHPNMVWKNETQLIKEYKDDKNIALEHCVDGVAYYNEGSDSIAIEVIGDKYTQKTIRAKVNIGMHFANHVHQI